jgi:hypothetical protein
MKRMLLVRVGCGFLALTAIVNSALAIGIDYPQRIEFDNGYVLVHAPQITAWEEFKVIEGRAVLEAYSNDGSDTILATGLFQADTQTDVDRRIVAVDGLVVKGITLADGSEATAEQRRLLQSAMPEAAREIPLDLVLSNLPDTVLAPDTPGIKAEPPVIHTVNSPALLLLTHGDPVAAPLKDNELSFIVNTNWTLFTNEKKTRWYLLNDKEWLTSKTLDGKWSYPRRLPKALQELPEGDNWKAARQAASQWKKPKSKPPLVISSSSPAELIVIDGDVDLKPIVEHFWYVRNTTSHVFYHRQNYYYLVSGRWFVSPALADGWKSVTELPEVFLTIPTDSVKADVRASVPGTMEARMAALEAVLPRRTEVDLDSKVVVNVTYAGDPKFEAIPGTKIQRAANTAFDILLVDGTYYLCYSAAWYTSATPEGPWLVANTVPDAVYDIPPSSPIHHTTYVRVEESSNVHVSFAYTAGYYGSYVAFGVPVWGTGWYYPPYVYYDPFYHGYPYYPHYYGYPHTYGSASFYNPRTGLYGSTSRYYGPYGSYGYTSTFNPRTGTYAAAESAWSGDQWAGQGVAYNPRTGRSFETERYYDGDDNKWKSTSTLAGRRGEVEVNRRRDEDGSRTRFDTSRGGTGLVTADKRAGGIDTRSEFETANGRTITGQGRFENGEGTANLRGSAGGRAEIERSVNGRSVKREGSFERNGETLNTTTRRNGGGPTTTFETSDGARGVVSGRALNKTAVGQSANGDLYAGSNGNVFRKTDNGWQRRSNGSWQGVDNRRSSTRTSPRTNNRGSANRYNSSNLSRDHRARSQGISQYRSRSSQFQSRGSRSGRIGGGRSRR